VKQSGWAVAKVCRIRVVANCDNLRTVGRDRLDEEIGMAGFFSPAREGGGLQIDARA
jgi:hypothetical protein